MGALGLTERLPLGPFSPKQAAATADEITSLGVSLGPALHEACGGHLGHIEWFRSPWQRSGAATGRTHWRLPCGEMVPAIVKAPVGYREYFWTNRLGGTDQMRYDDYESSHLPVPRVLQSGVELGGYDVAWLVVERVPGEPLTHRPGQEQMRLLFQAAARFQHMACDVQDIGLGRPEDEPDWQRLLARARERIQTNALLDPARWLSALDRVSERLDRIAAPWRRRTIDTWCHGDLHPGNAMVRDAAARVPPRVPQGLHSDPSPAAAPTPDPAADPCGVLIDLALVRTGAWFEDALYTERVHWGYEHLLDGVRPLEALAEARAALGLASDLRAAEEAAASRRTLTAAVSPAFNERADDARYLNACLDLLERHLA